ncbi:Hsp70 family protein, partial [Mycobacterium sp. ACS4331]|uniref:Hsp70 family protein n=1 Tax=Mycobacterium sp. ACS4331 TaxID=1834121 RepID=UPI00082AFAA7
MSDVLGLSIGQTNLGAARTGRSTVLRRSVLTLFGHRPAEVGLPSENPNLTEPGVVMWGFVERVGDPVPLVASDGSSHRGDALMAEALEALARTQDSGRRPDKITIAVPAHWGPAVVGSLRAALRNRPALFSDGAPPDLVSDAATALAALQTGPGLPDGGVVALCDFGGTGTTVALADAGAGLSPIGEAVRFTEFSGEQIDQALLNHVLATVQEGRDADPAGTAAVGSLAQLRGECRQAKERLSAETSTVIPVQLPGSTLDVRLTRAELENLIAEPLQGFLDTLGDTLERNRIPAAQLSAVATVGGGAAIPLLTQRLSELLRVPVITLPQPALAAATGAGVIAERGPSPDAPTGMAQAPDAADLPTGLAPAAWAAGAAGAAATQSASDGSPSATFRALAWSQDDETGGSAEPVPYSGEDYTFEHATSARPPVEFERETEVFGSSETEPPPLPWYRRPAVLFGAAAAALLTVSGVAVTLTSSSSSSEPVTETITLPNGEVRTTVFDEPTSATMTYTGTNGVVTSSVVPPPVTTTTTPPTTTTTQPTTTTPTTTTNTKTTPTPTTTTT